MIAHEFLTLVNELGEFHVSELYKYGNENTIRHTAQRQRRLKRIRITRIVGKTIYKEITEGGKNVLKYFDEHGCSRRECTCHQNENTEQ